MDVTRVFLSCVFICVTYTHFSTVTQSAFCVCVFCSGFYEEEFDDYNMGFSNMSFMGNRGRGGMRPPRGRMQGGMMMDDRPRGPPGSHYISKTGHSVHMRGMPFLAIEQDVFDVSFCTGLSIMVCVCVRTRAKWNSLNSIVVVFFIKSGCEKAHCLFACELESEIWEFVSIGL